MSILSSNSGFKEYENKQKEKIVEVNPFDVIS
jgi:hypothetical protein